MTPRQRAKFFRREIGAFIGRLNRSHAGSSKTGSFLENAAKLMQILAIVIGGAWVLNDYFEFKKVNNKLTNTQLQLATQAAAVTQTSIELNNQLSEFKLANTTMSRLEVVPDSSVVRSTKLGDGSFIYRFTFSISVKNVSDAPIVLPAMVLEFFVGSSPSKNLTPGQAFIINPPISWQSQPTPSTNPGFVTWTRRLQYANKLPDVDKALEDQIPAYDSTSPILLGEIRSGEAAGFQVNFVFRAQPKDAAGAVLTFWAGGQNERPSIFTETRTELLSEAEDARSLSMNDKQNKRIQKRLTPSAKM